MFPSAPDLSGRTTATIVPLPSGTHTAGFDPRSHYAETFWLPILGPSTMWLLRKMAERFDAEPDGFQIDLLEMSSALGIPSRGGRNNPFHRAMNRVVSFNLGSTVDEETIAVRRTMPALHNGQIRRLSPRLANLHDETMRARRGNREEDFRRSSNVALTLLQLGDSPDLVEQQLVTWGIEPSVAHDAVNDAWANKARQDQAMST